jgi:deoxyribose-phosphate aldolase
MVINLGWVKDRLWDLIEDEIESIRDVTEDAILKVIIETAVLDQKEKIHLCQIVSNSGADFIKTSTGFASGGATFEDVQLMREHVAKHVGVKASGGIRSLEDAERFLALGATRLGTSRLVSLAKEMSS